MTTWSRMTAEAAKAPTRLPPDCDTPPVRHHRGWLRKFLGHRIADKRVLRLIDKWLAAGVIEDGTWTECDQGSPQGSVSPLLANVYLHVRHEC